MYPTFSKYDNINIPHPINYFSTNLKFKTIYFNTNMKNIKKTNNNC